MAKSKEQQNTTAAPSLEQQGAEQQSINGQSAFHVELSPMGVVVRTVFVGEDTSLHAAPAAVFPNLQVALQQLEELKGLVLRQFSEAAFIGMQALQQAPKADAEGAAA